MRNLQVLHSEAPNCAILAALEQDGAVIINRLNSSQTMDQIQHELNKYMARSFNGNGEFWGRNTKRFGALIAKSKTFGEYCAANNKVLSIMDQVLGPRCDRYQLHVTMMSNIGPNETPQKLHRDDDLLPFAHPGPQSICNTMWALDDFTDQNGATSVILGSHNWPDGRLPGPEDQVVQAEMSRGSCLIYLGSVWHGGALNTTHDSWRAGLICGYSLGWLRQEENMYLAVPPHTAKNLPENLQHLLGYKIHGEFLGWVEAQDPHVVLEDRYSDVMAAENIVSQSTIDSKVFKTAALGDPQWFDLP